MTSLLLHQVCYVPEPARVWQDAADAGTRQRFASCRVVSP